ncbi:cytochrome C oxidase subunit IV family protein [Nocardioides sp. WS12]|uniref:cytochrome C oxidase subunit IV family protein n=1 Tax=Nocardioides sp. WS12 TaxID=2486272 RepID=UPI0015F929F3|nr:cytochrome C oxidase subunit IV family protein [Nocardioides sp. WS12]
MSTLDTNARSTINLFRSKATVVWVFLILATVLSWALGTDHGFVDDHTTASTIIMVVAFVKVRFVGLYFMELNHAPLALRLLLEVWCLVVCLATLGFYFAA